mmetsp:Transcript_20001/g.37175  ORF Transcript_20001/g.37175 Transcript_20001/m.37175 type:complete len:360 (-) Transcript_20001:76-1155(-)
MQGALRQFVAFVCVGINMTSYLPVDLSGSAWRGQNVVLAGRPKAAALQGGLNDASTDTKVTKELAVLASSRVRLKHGAKDAKNLLFINTLAVHLAHAVTCESTTEVHVILARSFANKANLCHGRTAAAVGATGHTNRDSIVAEPVTVEQYLDLGNQRWQVGLRLCHGQSTGRQSNTGHRVQTHGGILGVVEVVLLHDGLDKRFAVLGDSADDDVLRSGQVHLSTGVVLSNFAKSGLDLVVFGILDVPILNEESVLPGPIFALVPSIGVGIRVELEWVILSKFEAADCFYLAAENVETHVFHGVFQARMLAVFALSMVALNKHNGLRNLDGLFGGAKAHNVSETRISSLVSVSGTHASAD